MARLPRLSLAGLPHLVLLLAHNGQPLFTDDVDRAAFVAQLAAAARGPGVRVMAYGLGSTEVHLLATPERPEHLSAMMQRLARGYGLVYNRRHGRAGTLWNGRFRATVVDPDSLLLDATRYVESAAAEAAVVHGGDPWSSAAHYLGERADTIVADSSAYWKLGNTPFERAAAYRRLCDVALPDAQVQRLRAVTLKGWPVGSPAFLKALAGRTDRPMGPRPRGRPRKSLSHGSLSPIKLEGQ